MKHLMISLLGALAIAGAVQAAEPQAAPQAPGSHASSTAQEETNKADASDYRCLRHTGTRISSRTDSRKQRACGNAGIGRAYTREDLNRTGEVNIAEALRKLDPSIR